MANILLKAIIGSPQSKYASIAIMITIFIFCFAVLFMESEVPLGKRLLSILFILLMAIPGIVLGLVELTCLVTGGSWNGKNWWCYGYSWVIAAFVIIYCFILIYSIINSIITYKDALTKSDNYDKSKKLSQEAVSYTHLTLPTPPYV